MRRGIVLVLVVLAIAIAALLLSVAPPTKTPVKAKIIDAIPSNRGLVITVTTSDGHLYRLLINATTINTSELVFLKFEKGVPVDVIQGNSTFAVINCTPLKTLEHMPRAGGWTK